MTRRTLLLTLALLTGLLTNAGGPAAGAPSPSSIDGLGAALQDGTLSVAGKATFGGLDPAGVGTDPAGDAPVPLQVGLDLTDALIGQPDAETGDLLFVLRLADLPSSGALPEAARYTWDFSVNRPGASPVAFEIDGKLTDATGRASARRPSFSLRENCTNTSGIVTCFDVELLAATIDPTAKEIRVTVPRRILEEQLDASIAGATIAPASICEGITAKLSSSLSLCGGAAAGAGDRLAQGQGDVYAIAGRTVRVATSPEGQQPDFADAPAATLGADGSFSASLDGSAVPEGAQVWAQACFGTNCGAASVPVGTPYVPPAAGWKPPVLVSGTQAHRETSIALSPTNPNSIFVCAPSGVPNTSGNQSYFHLSADGGAKWAYEDVEGGATDSRNYAFEGGDCDVEFDRGGTMYSADTWLGSLSVGHSTDGGATWDGTFIAASAPIVDRPWLVGGPAGTVHVSYEDLQCCMPATIWYTRSTDYGKTFLPVVPVADAGPEGAFTWEGNLVVSPDQNDLYLVYTRRQGPALLGGLDGQGPETVWVASSHDAGLTWSSTKIASMPNPASYLYPSIALDRGGFLHVVFASRTGVDRPIWYSFSSDAGKTWSEPTAIMRGAAGYSPWIDGGRPGEAAITWYGSPAPDATISTNSDWYFYWAKVTGVQRGTPTFTSGVTTSTPIFRGVQGETPEFENVMLDASGRMHLGMSAKRSSGGTRWAIWYQREI